MAMVWLVAVRTEERRGQGDVGRVVAHVLANRERAVASALSRHAIERSASASRGLARSPSP